MKGSRKRLQLINKQSSKPRWLEVKKQGRIVISRTNLKNCGGFHRTMCIGPIERQGRHREAEKEEGKVTEKECTWQITQQKERV